MEIVKCKVYILNFNEYSAWLATIITYSIGISMKEKISQILDF